MISPCRHGRARRPRLREPGCTDMSDANKKRALATRSVVIKCEFFGAQPQARRAQAVRRAIAAFFGDLLVCSQFVHI